MSEAPNRIPEIRKDSIHNRWVIFSPARSRRPSDFKAKSSDPNPNSKSSECPFCIGHEHECAPEIFRVPPGSSGWKIRVIQNLYPALSRDLLTTESEYSKNIDGVTDVETVQGFGFHDVVIESTVHSVHLVDLSPVQVGDVLLAYKKRIEQLLKFDSIKYIQVFKNHGASAGASMSHSHSQIIALPIVPPLVFARIAGMKECFEQTGKCGLCKIESNELLIDKSPHFIAIAPLASASPFEIWIIPRDHSSHFHEIETHKAIDLGGILKLILQKISLQLNNPPFNFMIHTSPLQIEPSHLSYVHWFIQIIPQLSMVGGFELGTGCNINPVFPEDAAKVLREMDLHESVFAKFDDKSMVCSPIQTIKPRVDLTVLSPFIKKVSRTNNFSIDEDILLVSARLNVSLDEEHGYKKRYWDRMYDYFHKYKKFQSERNQNSLTHRWSAIQLATKKFCVCFAEIEPKHQGGVKTEHDKILHAKQLYRETHKSSFQFEHCWNELRHHPKWIEEILRKKMKKWKDISPGSSQSIPNSISISLEEENNPPSESFTSMEMLEVRQVGKEKPIKRNNILVGVGDEQTKSLVGMREEKMKYLELEQEERIMTTDFTNMSAIQAEYFKRRQLEIMQKRNWM